MKRIIKVLVKLFQKLAGCGAEPCSKKDIKRKGYKYEKE
jgi:hypothetical protein